MVGRGITNIRQHQLLGMATMWNLCTRQRRLIAHCSSSATLRVSQPLEPQLNSCPLPRFSFAAKMELATEQAVARAAARAAGEVLRSARAHGFEISQKTGGEVVTDADRAANDAIVTELRVAFAEDVVFSEESPDPSGRLEAERVWIVDPLDGTSDFVRGGDSFTVSIGLSIATQAVLGVVYNPVHDRLYCGIVGEGVVVNEQPTTVSAVTELASAHLVVSAKEWARGLGRIADGLVIVQHTSMAFKLAEVAAGRADGVFSLKGRKEWGVCAGTALVRAAGGMVTDLSGAPLTFNHSAGRPFDGLVAAGPGIHGKLVALLKDRRTHGGWE